MKKLNHLAASRRAFTLIELLVVIAVIATLAAIVLPVFFSIRESSRRTVCLSNERQLGMAMFQYLGDNNDIFPPSFQDAGVGWAEKCYRYVNNAQTFRCPDDPTQTIILENTPPIPWVPISYGLNSNLGGAIGFLPPPAHNRQHETAMLSIVSAPAQTAMFFEINSNRTTLPFDLVGSAAGNAGDDCGKAARTFPCTGTIGFDLHPNNHQARYSTGNVGARFLNGDEGSIPRHRDGANYLACDGHAKWLKPQSVSGGTNATAQECAQGTDQPQPGACANQLPGSVAGTSNPKYSLTFSIK